MNFKVTKTGDNRVTVVMLMASTLLALPGLIVAVKMLAVKSGSLSEKSWLLVSASWTYIFSAIALACVFDIAFKHINPSTSLNVLPLSEQAHSLLCQNCIERGASTDLLPTPEGWYCSECDVIVHE